MQRVRQVLMEMIKDIIRLTEVRRAFGAKDRAVRGSRASLSSRDNQALLSKGDQVLLQGIIQLILSLMIGRVVTVAMHRSVVAEINVSTSGVIGTYKNVPSDSTQNTALNLTDKRAHVVTRLALSQMRSHVELVVGGVFTRGTDRAFERHD